METLTIAQAARRLRLSPTTLRNRAARQRLGLPVIRAGRRVVGFAAADVDALLERGRERFEPDDAGTGA